MLKWDIQRINLWRKKPIEYFKDTWNDIILWDKLEEILVGVGKHKKVVVPSGHGIGKTFLAARIVIWFLYCFPPAKVITTAPTWSQVEKILWSEIGKAYGDSKMPLGGRLLTTSLTLDKDWFAVGISTRESVAEREFGASKFQGFHSPNLLVILDEAAGVSNAIWTATDTLVTGDNNKILAIGNPMSPSGDFYEACKSPLWEKIHISCFDHPNIKGGMSIPGAVSKEWIEDKRIKWGEGSPLWQAKVLGEFPDEGTDTLVPLSWYENSLTKGFKEDGKRKLGVDVARFGDNETVFQSKFGKVFKKPKVIKSQDTMRVAGEVINMHKRDKYECIAIDTIGIGAGVYDRLAEKGLPVYEFVASGKAIEPERYVNVRAEAFWMLRVGLDPKQTIFKAPDDMMTKNQLTGIKYFFTSRGEGAIRIESKDDMMKRGLVSPDRADAMAICEYADKLELKEEEPEIFFA